MKRIYLLASLVITILSSCNNNVQQKQTAKTDTLTEAQKHLPENALKGLTVFEGLTVRPFATEPMLKNPTNIDVDERGRVWVTEAYNYRPAINSNPTNALGDRIMILQDNNADGQADTAKVFYQGPEINAPLGICVLGNKVIVSQSPYVWVFYDDNGDDKADRKEVLFSGIGGEQHDHGVHAFTFGPDGKLYFNMGNEGKTLKDKNGKTVIDQDGNPIDKAHYKQGMVFRCDVDGSHVECLGQNFRNPYEVAVDSYGLLWQSDNDDDGNRGVRINYMMDYGNYGYTDEMTGAGWQANRTNIEDSIPYRHWHLNDPGAVPNLLQTGAGSPTGMVVYEGKMLPDEFKGQLIHADAGPNVVRAYSIKNKGAGYSASIINILEGSKDKWFRPADVCIAPDGSLIVADWYDVGVGGHQAGDQVRGRIYRVTPHINSATYKLPAFDYTTPEGAGYALLNANLSVRYHAFTALQQMGSKALPFLENIWHTNANPRMKARAFWALVKMPGINNAKYFAQALKDKNTNIRILAIRAAREQKTNVIDVVKQLVNDKDPQVRRECALALHHNKSADAASLWATLAAGHGGKDRWYLEALGIGADKQWDSFFKAYLALNKNPLQTAAGRDIVWRARTQEAVPYIAKLAQQQDVNIHDRLRYFRAFDFNEGPVTSKVLLAMLEKNTTHDTALSKLVLQHLDIKTVKGSAVAQQALKDVLQSVTETPEFVELVRRYNVSAENPALLQLAINKSDEGIAKDAAGLLLSQNGQQLAWNIINAKDTAQTKALLTSLSGVGSKESLSILQTVALSKKYNVALQKDAASKIGKSWDGEEMVLTLLKNKKVPQALIPDVVASVSGAWRGSVRAEAASYLSNAGIAAIKPAPMYAQLASLKTNTTDGKTVFTATCALCHMVNNEGNDFGPKLSEIGSKYPKEGLLNAIVHPSAGISFGFEGWQLKMKDGSTLSGIISSKTETDIDLKLPGGNVQHLKTSDVLALQQMKESMMPEGLYQNLSSQQLADLLDYLESLKKK